MEQQNTLGGRLSWWEQKYNGFAGGIEIFDLQKLLMLILFRMNNLEKNY